MRKGLSLVLIGILAFSVYVPVVAPDGNMVSVILETTDKQAIRNVVEAAGGHITIEYITVNMVAAEVPLSKLGDVLKNSYVLNAYKDDLQYLPQPPQAPVGDSDNFEAQTVLDMSEFTVESFGAEEIQELPETFYNYMITGAEDIWHNTNYGDGTVVAVIDTGTYPYHPMFMYPDNTSSVIGGINFYPGEPSNSWGDPGNHYHGTVVAGIIGGHGAIVLPTTHYLAQSIMLYAPDSYIPYGPGRILVPLLGMAPEAKIYAIKVFPKSGAGSPTSVIMQGIDHAIYMRQLYDTTGGAQGVPIDVINMSLGGATGYDGKNAEDILVDKATDTGIVVVVAAGNDGPAYNTVSRPATAYTSIAVGAAADPPHTRVGWDITYRTAGIGEYFYPYDEVQIIYFSGRGPMGDGRLAPDILACGVYAMSAFPPASIGVMSGTSSACPAVAGGAALLVAWQKMNQGYANPYQIRNAIIEGGTPLQIPYSEFAQGNGHLNMPNSLVLLQNGIDGGLHLKKGYKLHPTDLKGGTETWSTSILGPGRTFDIVIAVDEDTRRIDVCLSNVTHSGSSNPFLGDSFEFYIQSAVRTSEVSYYFSENIYGDRCFTITDPNPGNIRIVLEGDWTNWGIMSCDVTVTETEGRSNLGGHKETIATDEWGIYYVDVPEGLSAVVFEVWWMHDWSKFPTYDLDMYVIDPNGNVYVDGAQLFSPEKQIIVNPVPGTYIVLVNGYEINHGREPYQVHIYYIA